MASAYISTSTLSNDILDVMNKQAEFDFKPQLIFSQAAESKVHVNGVDADPSDTVKFPIYNNMNPALTALTETSGPDSVAISDNLKSVTLTEYGNVTTTTEKIEQLSTVQGVMSSTVPSLVGGNMGESTDLLARATFDTQTGTDYVTYVGQTAKASIAAGNILTAAEVRKARAKLERENVPVDDRFGSYLWIAHPDVIHDLRKETGDAAWLTLAKYADPQAALQGEVGMFDGFRFLQTTNVSWEPDAGAAAQTATTVDGAHATVGVTTLAVASATGIVAGDDITVTVSSVDYTYPVSAVSTNDLTIGKCFRIDGNPYRAASAGTVVAHAGGEAVKEGVDVFTSYVIGKQALAYAHAVRPEIRVTGPFDNLGRLLNVGWYALHGYGELRPESLHKVFSASSIANNA